MLEECGLPYRVIPVNIGRGEQFSPEFLAISPNNRMPAIVDHEPPDGGEPISVFETGAILLYLAEKTGRFVPKDDPRRDAVMQWLMWQMGGLGPMVGQHGHFVLYAPRRSRTRSSATATRCARLYGVLDAQLGTHRRLRRGRVLDRRHGHLPVDHDAQGTGALAGRMAEPEALVRAAARAAARCSDRARQGAPQAGPPDKEARKHLFGQATKPPGSA